MHNKYLTAISGTILIAALILTGCGTAGAAQVNQPTNPAPAPRTLVVNGSGKAYLTPDMANISIGVHTEAKDAAEAVSSNNSRSEKVATALKNFDIAAEDIQTTNFSIYPRQEYDQQGKVIATTYSVDNTVFVTIRDLDKIGEILNAVVEVGANSINNIQFDVTDKTAALAEARKAAIADAQTQAKELAEAAGVKLGDIQNISTSGGFPVPIVQGRGGIALAEQAAVPVSPGQMTLSIDVNVIYEIK